MWLMIVRKGWVTVGPERQIIVAMTIRVRAWTGTDFKWKQPGDAALIQTFKPPDEVNDLESYNIWLYYHCACLKLRHSGTFRVR